MTWYYAQGDQRQGPVSDSELDALIAAGTVNETTLVWKEGMVNWTPLKEARPAGAPSEEVPAGWIKCTSTGRFFPPEEIVYLDGKPYSAAAKAAVLQGVLQTGTLPAADQNRNGPPWENRHEIGFFPAIFQTVRGVMLDPASTFSQMRREGGLGAPLGFDVLMSTAGTFVIFIYNFGYQAIFASMAPTTQSPISQWAASSTIMGIMVILTPVITVFGAFIGAGLLHLILMLCQGARQPFETTFRTYTYCMGGVAPLCVIPFCGAYAALIWAIVSMCIGLAKTHDTTSGRSVLSVLLSFFVCCAVVVVIYIMLIAVVVASMSAGAATHH
ncbi:MAG TPA: GYF domain-containing protein [Chthoniobacter sp.]|nr:GYF domain-containing protein [Chthoniobacter sp.]